jgi:hypothetical protein
LAPVITLTPINTLPPVNTQVVLQPTSSAAVCDRMKLITEDPLDDKQFTAGDKFTKKWTIQNIGTCTWTTDYKLVFASGEQMGGPADLNLTQSVPPLGQYTVSVDLTVPSKSGTLKGNWLLQNQAGDRFGVDQYNNPIWVQIKIGSNPSTFAVTSATPFIDQVCNSSGSAKIVVPVKVNRSGNVKFWWVLDDVQEGGTIDLTFSTAGTDNNAKTFTGLGTGDHYVQIYVDDPNNQFFPKVKVTCP